MYIVFVYTSWSYSEEQKDVKNVTAILWEIEKVYKTADWRSGSKEHLSELEVEQSSRGEGQSRCGAALRGARPVVDLTRASRAATSPVLVPHRP